MDSIYIERNGIYNHWGIWVDPDVPITGVVSNNSVNPFIFECIAYEDSINLDYEAHLESDEHQHYNDDNCEICEYWEDYNSTILIGDWIKDSDGLWDYDPNGEYAAIVRESVTQVVFSKYFKSCQLCSPCYPGQADLDSDGDFKAYNLPPEAYKY